MWLSPPPSPRQATCAHCTLWLPAHEHSEIQLTPAATAAGTGTDGELVLARLRHRQRVPRWRVFTLCLGAAMLLAAPLAAHSNIVWYCAAAGPGSCIFAIPVRLRPAAQRPRPPPPHALVCSRPFARRPRAPPPVAAAAAGNECGRVRAILLLSTSLPLLGVWAGGVRLGS